MKTRIIADRMTTTGGSFNWPPSIPFAPPVLAYDWRDWSGGDPVPDGTGATDEFVGCGTIPNTGTAGSDYDLPVWVMYVTEFLGSPIDPYWRILARHRTDVEAPLVSWVPPATFWSDLGGGPLDDPFTFFCELGEPVNDFRDLPLGEQNGCRGFRIEVADDDEDIELQLELDYQGDSSGNGFTFDARLAVSGEGDNDFRVGVGWDNFEPTTFSFEDRLGTCYFDPDAGIGKILADHLDGTDDDPAFYDRDLTSAGRADLNSAAFDPPGIAYFFGWFDSERHDSIPVKGAVSKGMRSIQMVRGCPTVEDVERVRVEMGL